MPSLLEDLLRQLPSDTEDRVKKARENFNRDVRDALRGETRFSFQRHKQGSRDEVINVPIAVRPGLPETLQPRDVQSIDEKFRLSLFLAPYRKVLTGLRDNGQAASEQLILALVKEPLASPLLNGQEKLIDPAWRYADFLLKKLNEFELTKFILRVNSDVLGVYRYRVKTAWDDPEPRIDLYWGVIGLVARDLAVEVEDLTCVVLAHELAHAYTHVGADANDHFWATAHFHASAIELVEGLAQYYTERVCRRVQGETPGPLRAYQALLPHQPCAYKVHLDWKENEPEQVRLAMLEARRSGGPATLVQFAICLKNARMHLRT